MSVSLHIVGTRSERISCRCSGQPTVCLQSAHPFLLVQLFPFIFQAQTSHKQSPLFCCPSWNQENPSQSVSQAWQPTTACWHEIILTAVLPEPLQMSMTQLRNKILRFFLGYWHVFFFSNTKQTLTPLIFRGQALIRAHAVLFFLFSLRTPREGHSEP